VTFTPTVSGTRTGSLTVTDNAQGSPQVVNITGAGADFSLAGSPSSDTIQPGSAASYKLTVSSIGGSFVNAVQLTCSGKIPGLRSLDSVASDRFIWNPADRIKKPEQENPLPCVCGLLDGSFNLDDGMRRGHGYRADFSDAPTSNRYRAWNLYRHGYRHFGQSATLAPCNARCPVRQSASCDEISKDMIV
jgi:hypothetical protein